MLRDFQLGNPGAGHVFGGEQVFPFGGDEVARHGDSPGLDGQGGGDALQEFFGLGSFFVAGGDTKYPEEHLQ